MSELIAEVDPSVSTERNRLTIAPALASCVVPMVRTVVTTAGSAVGIADTEKATAARKRVWNGAPRSSPSVIEATSAKPAMIRICPVSRSSWTVSGVFSVLVVCSILEMCPTSVAIPVEVTTMVPAPRVTFVFMKAMSSRSPSPLSSDTVSTCLGTGRLSPVSADSSISSVAARMILPSAGTMSPASMLTTSPGTSWSMGSSLSCASRQTLVLTTIIFCRAATLAAAFPSWFSPRNALNRVRMIKRMPVSS